MSLTTPEDRSPDEIVADYAAELVEPAPNSHLVNQIPAQSLMAWPKLVWVALSARPLAHVANIPNGLYAIRNTSLKLVAFMDVTDWRGYPPIIFDEYAFLGPLKSSDGQEWRFVG
jgi:hypothetical protein